MVPIQTRLWSLAVMQSYLPIESKVTLQIYSNPRSVVWATTQVLLLKHVLMGNIYMSSNTYTTGKILLGRFQYLERQNLTAKSNISHNHLQLATATLPALIQTQLLLRQIKQERSHLPKRFGRTKGVVMLTISCIHLLAGLTKIPFPKVWKRVTIINFLLLYEMFTKQK